MTGHALRREGRLSSIAPHRTLWRAQSRLSVPPACDAPRILPAKPSGQTSSNAKPPRTSHCVTAQRIDISRTLSARNAQQPLPRFITRYRAPYSRACIPPAARSFLQSYPARSPQRDSCNISSLRTISSQNAKAAAQSGSRTARRFVILIMPLPAFQWRGRIS